MIGAEPWALRAGAAGAVLPNHPDAAGASARAGNAAYGESGSDGDRARRMNARVRAPIVLFSVFYLAFVFVLWIPLADWMPQVLRSLTVPADLLGFTPRPAVLLLYLSGLACVWLGYLGARPLTAGIRRADANGGPARPRGLAAVHQLARRSAGLTRRLPAPWRWVILAAGLAFVAQLVMLRAIPLFDIKSRWGLSAKLVAIIALSIAFAASIVAFRGWRLPTWISVILIFSGLSLLGTRTLPLVMLVAVLVCTCLYSSRRTIKRAVLVGVGAVVLVMLSVGVITKTGIYDSSGGYQALKGIGLLQTDSIGTFYNLTVVVDKIDSLGTMGGRLFLDTLLNLIPGTHSEYANYQLGALIGGSTHLDLGGTVINRSVSLSTTMVGPSYADGGWVAVVVFAILVGVLWRLFEDAALHRLWFAGLFGYWVGQIFDGVYAGAYSTSVFSVTILCLFFYYFAVRGSRSLLAGQVAPPMPERPWAPRESASNWTGSRTTHNIVPQDVGSNRVSIQDSLRLVRRRWWILAVCAVLGVVAAGSVALLSNRQYVSTVRLLVATPSIDQSALVPPGGVTAEQRAINYAQLVKGNTIPQQVMTELHLTEPLQNLLQNLGAGVAPGTTTIVITVQDDQPARAQRIAQAFATELVTYVPKIEAASGATESPATITIMDPANLPETAVARGTVSKVVLGLVLGLLVGAAILGVLGFLESRSLHPGRLRTLTGAPVLATISGPTPNGGAALVDFARDRDARAESFRSLRTTLQHVQFEHGTPMLTVAGVRSTSGTTSVAANIAVSMAQAGQRTLLVDANLYRPRVAEMFGLTPRVGLADVLTGAATAPEAIVRSGAGDLDVMAAGTLPPNPTELLQSKATDGLLAKLRGEYDVVVLDAPPLLAVSDAAILAAVTDGALLVARYGRIPDRDVISAAQSIAMVDAALIGSVLTDTPAWSMVGERGVYPPAEADSRSR